MLNLNIDKLKNEPEYLTNVRVVLTALVKDGSESCKREAYEAWFTVNGLVGCRTQPSLTSFPKRRVNHCAKINMNKLGRDAGFMVGHDGRSRLSPEMPGFHTGITTRQLSEALYWCGL